jgi:hypothetical protein
MRYLVNGFLLIVPLLVVNAVYARRLPAGFQEPAWNAIPTPLAWAERLLRVPALGLPLLLPVSLAGPIGWVGAALYLAGALTYLAAWTIQVLRPASAWSTSAAGFLAPAYTPALWLAGIGLLGIHSAIAHLAYLPWIYLAAVAAFVAVHTLHAGLVNHQIGARASR